MVKWTKGDKILVGVLFSVTLILISQMDLSTRKGDWAVIEVDQKVVKRVPLTKNQIIPVEGRLGVTQVEILDGRAHIHSSPCQNKVCIKSGFIQSTNRVAACLPNRVVLKVQSNSIEGVDAIIG
ncbi:MAG: NusG domain II-containing protein [Nitrospinales bacterium]